MSFDLTGNFDWTLPNKRAINEKINGPEGLRVYSYNNYENIQGLIDFYFKHDFSQFDSVGKDLKEGEVYPCRITNMSEDDALAQTDSGQTIYIDLKKERRDALKLNIQDSISFQVGSEFKASVRKIGGSYFGSVVDYYVKNVRDEFFEQIKKGTHAYMAKVESINKGGYIASISGIKCFLPGSLAAANRITDFESYIGKEIPVMIEGYVDVKDIFIISYKKYLSNIMSSKIQELDLTKKYKGSVTGTSEFGVFVEWDDIYTGLIHKTEFDGNSNIGAFAPGDEIEFYIKEIKENNRLTLTLGKPLEKNVILHEIETRINSGYQETHEAKVKHVRKNGILVELVSLGLMALVPQDRAGKIARNLKPGDFINVSIYEVEVSSGKIFAEPINE